MYYKMLSIELTKVTIKIIVIYKLSIIYVRIAYNY